MTENTGRPFVIFDLKGDPEEFEVCGVTSERVLEIMKDDPEHKQLIHECIAEIHKLLIAKQDAALRHIASVERMTKGLDG